MAENAPDTPPREGDRIAKLLARAGVASRREVERMIAEGRVAIGGRTVETANTVLTGLEGVTVDGRPVARPEPARLFRFHKPGGLITAERDPTGRPTIYTALRNALPPGTPRMMPVGRLDLNTEGLLLLTNDGGLKRALELPSSGVPRTYRARTFGDVSQATLEELMDGITIDGVRYGPINANLERSTGRNQWIELTLAEGKNREVRRVLEHLGLAVSRLLRLAYGPFELGDLARGQAHEVRQADVERLRKSLRMAPEAGVEQASPTRPGAEGPAQSPTRDARAQRRAPSRRPQSPDRDGAPRDRKQTTIGTLGPDAAERSKRGPGRGGSSSNSAKRGMVAKTPGPRNAGPRSRGSSDAGPGNREPGSAGLGHRGPGSGKPGTRAPSVGKTGPRGPGPYRKAPR